MSARVPPDARPRLARGVRLHQDRARGRTVLLAPERVISPNPSAVEILRRCDGTLTFAAIVEDLARVHRAEPGRIAADASALLRDLADRRMVEL
ncbi:MAG: pyrroloquinoline quinone biosynthesis peptide chaperone PqqD [Hyphomicrobiaceae bacterium]|nr:pyrroloquinoline quinone biosynthesis peptide chaperone PqqD [Hyphomicrobiaceae bacterium]